MTCSTRAVRPEGQNHEKGSSDATHSDLDKITISLIESIAKQVRTNIDSGSCQTSSSRSVVLTM